MAEAFALAERYHAALVRNFDKWDILGERSMEYTSFEVCEIETFEGQIAYLENWLEESLAYLRAEYVK